MCYLLHSFSCLLLSQSSGCNTSSVYRYSCIPICVSSAPHYASHLCHHCNDSISFHCKAVAIKSSIIACLYTFIYLILKHVLRGSIARLWEGCFTRLLCLFSQAEATIFLAVESRHLFFWTVRYELEDELSGVILPSRLLASNVMSLECERKLKTLNSHFICCPSNITKHNANCIFFVWTKLSIKLSRWLKQHWFQKGGWKFVSWKCTSHF